ncbi:MAG: hypothetical protein GX875_06045 [Propionibacterium sp.]|nr:hypothetical protein [Propionibacterium sp.]
MARKDGRLRTITVVFDEPTAEVDAKRLAEQVSGLTVCGTASGERNTLSNRAELVEASAA